MLTTNLRSTQTLDPCIGVAPAEGVRPKPVTAAAYPFSAPAAAATSATCTCGTTRAFATSFASSDITSIDAGWLSNGRKPMPVVHLHPDRWPPQSTS